MMRARTLALFDSGDLGLAAKEESLQAGLGCVVRQELVHPLAVVVFDTQSADEHLVEDEVTDEDCNRLVISVNDVPDFTMKSRASMVV